MVKKIAVLCFMVLTMTTVSSDDSMMTRCSAVLTNVAPCLPFATGQAAVPTSQCCTSVTTMRNSDPACLCFVIQQVHSGTKAIRDMGVQESRLLQLSSACRVANASISECPRLLHLAPNSTDAAIFTTNSTSSPITTPISTPGTSSRSTTSQGFWIKPQLTGSVIATAIVMFLVAFPSEFLSS